MTALFPLFANLVVQIAVLEAQTVKLAQVPRHKGRIADGLFARASKAGRIVVEKTGRPLARKLRFRIGIAAKGKHAPESRVALDALTVTEKLSAQGKALVQCARQRLIAVGHVDTVQGPAAAAVVGNPNRRRICEAGAELKTVIVGEVQISVQPAKISKAAPGPRFAVIQAVVFFTNFVVTADGAAQKKRSRKQIAQLGAIRFGFTSDDPLQRQRHVDERQLMHMEFGQDRKSVG